MRTLRHLFYRFLHPQALRSSRYSETTPNYLLPSTAASNVSKASPSRYHEYLDIGGPRPARQTSTTGPARHRRVGCRRGVLASTRASSRESFSSSGVSPMYWPKWNRKDEFASSSFLQISPRRSRWSFARAFIG